MTLGINEAGNTRGLYTLIQETISKIDALHNNNLVFVNSRADLPAGSPIQLVDNVTYLFTRHVDLLGTYARCGLNNCVLGFSSENCSVTSTGLPEGTPILVSTETTVIRHITIKNVHTALDFDGDGTTMALDWTGVNFSNIPNVGTIKNFSNLMFNNGAFLSANGLILDGTFGTAAFESSLFSGQNIATPIVKVANSAIVSTRFRMIYSSVIVPENAIGIDVSDAATIGNERYILDAVNFAGNGTKQSGVTYTSNKALFTKCVGIQNTSISGQIYMQDNATPTVLGSPGVFTKILGTTTPSADNSKVITDTNGRITIDAAVSRKYRIDCTLNFNSTAGNVCKFGFYDSFLNNVRLPSRQSSTANAAGRAESISFFCYATRQQDHYFEVWGTNLSPNNFTVTDMNFSLTEA